MCGISGIINSNGNAYGTGGIKAMTGLVRHRGPDDAGYVLIGNDGKATAAGDADTPEAIYTTTTPYSPVAGIDSLPNDGYKVMLGHRRLSILDLSPFGHCPMCYADGRYWITFNGEIYNFNELKAELVSLGYQFVSHTDTEVILAAYACWGTECLHRFHGMWAFAIYDTQQQEIFLARDRFGIKPLYYWLSPNQSFCFASEIKQFTVLPGWKAILNRQRAFDYLLYNVTDHTEETMFTGVLHIPAGCYFKSGINTITAAANGKVATTKWYHPSYKGFAGSFDAAVNRFRQLFCTSVKEHMVADVPVGFALSGGLDSSSLVCAADKMIKEEKRTQSQKTFSFFSAGHRYDERKWIDEVNSHTNTEPHYITENGERVFTMAESLIWHHDEPNQSQSELATCLVYKAAKENDIKVLISGMGADEYISGYEAFKTFRFVQLFKRGKLKKLRGEMTGDPNWNGGGLLKSCIRLSYFLVPGIVTRYLGRRTKAYKNLKQLISVQKLQAKEKHPFDYIPYNNSSIFNIAHKQVMHFPLQKYLRFEDRMSMLNSVEARVPFLDHQLVEFTTQLPVEYLDGKGESKKILKHGMQDILPVKIQNRVDKIGFVTPEETWVKKTYTATYRKMIEEAIRHSRGIITPAALVYFDKVSSGEIPFDYTYWRLIAFGLWIKQFNVETGL